MTIVIPVSRPVSPPLPVYDGMSPPAALAGTIPPPPAALYVAHPPHPVDPFHPRLHPLHHPLPHHRPATLQFSLTCSTHAPSSHLPHLLIRHRRMVLLSPLVLFLSSHTCPFTSPPSPSCRAPLSSDSRHRPVCVAANSSPAGAHNGVVSPRDTPLGGRRPPAMPPVGGRQRQGPTPQVPRSGARPRGSARVLAWQSGV